MVEFGQIGRPADSVDLRRCTQWPIYCSLRQFRGSQDLSSLGLEPGLKLKFLDARNSIESSSDDAPAPITQGNLLFFVVLPGLGECLVDKILRPTALHQISSGKRLPLSI